jgi:ABC-type Fe3+-hydroxamate transport system substrate-binding protein
MQDTFVQEERWSMSPEDKDALIGCAIRQKKEAEEKLAMLEAQAKKIGERLVQLGNLLRDRPQNVWFDAMSTGTRYSVPGVTTFKPADADGKMIVTLTDQIRDANDELLRATESAKKLGF